MTEEFVNKAASIVLRFHCRGNKQNCQPQHMTHLKRSPQKNYICYCSYPRVFFLFDSFALVPIDVKRKLTIFAVKAMAGDICCE